MGSNSLFCPPNASHTGAHTLAQIPPHRYSHVNMNSHTHIHTESYTWTQTLILTHTDKINIVLKTNKPEKSERNL